MTDPNVDSADEPAGGSEPSASPSENGQEPGSGRPIWVWIAAAIAVLAVVGGIAIAVRNQRSASPDVGKTVAPPPATAPITPVAPIPAGTTSVPNVVGLSKANAERTLSGAGFIPLAAVVVTSAVAPGAVIAQAPGAETGLVSGSQVAFCVAQANPPDPSQSLPAPNAYQMSKSQAQSMLMNAGLLPVFIFLPSEEAKDLVFAQAPLTSEPVQMGGVVLAALSTGVAPKTASVRIPDVVGASQADAVKSLEGAGLSSQVVLGPNAATPKGAVFKQLPQASGLVGPGTPVALAVSLGPIPSSDTMATVPDVVGMDANTAVRTLADAGLLTQQADIDDKQTARGQVAGQVPFARWTVPSGSVAIICVASTPQ